MQFQTKFTHFENQLKLIGVQSNIKNIGRNPIVDCERNGEIEKNRKKQKRIERNRKNKKNRKEQNRKGQKRTIQKMI